MFKRFRHEVPEADTTCVLNASEPLIILDQMPPRIAQPWGTLSSTEGQRGPIVHESLFRATFRSPDLDISEFYVRVSRRSRLVPTILARCP